jgi:hypothetical protein
VDKIAEETGFIKRKRKVTGSNFLKTVLFAWLKEADVSVEGLARSGFDHGLDYLGARLRQTF